MAQFDVFENPISWGRKAAPFVVVLQSDLITVRETTIVAPLVRKVDPGGHAKLQRAVLVSGVPFVVLFQAISTVRSKDLAQPVAKLPELRDCMMAAFDFLFLGF